MTVTIAFYKGRARRMCHRAIDTAIRLRTFSKYSHVELIPDVAEIGKPARCLSSSARDGGVRETAFLLKPGHWDLIELDVPADPAVEFIRHVFGAGYDFTGILLSQAIPLDIHGRDTWFCSELVGYSLGMMNAHALSPGMLFDQCLIHPSYRGVTFG